MSCIAQAGTKRILGPGALSIELTNVFLVVCVPQLCCQALLNHPARLGAKESIRHVHTTACTSQLERFQVRG